MNLLYCGSNTYGLSIDGYGGAGWGTLTEGGRVHPLLCAPVGGRLALRFALNPRIAWEFIGVSHRMEASYQYNQRNYQGVFTGMGGGGGMVFHLGQNWIAGLGGVSWTQMHVSVKSQDSAEVNGAVFRHATYSLYTAPQGSALQVSILKEKHDDQFSPDQRMRIGILCEYNMLTFTGAKTIITTTDSRKTPNSYDTHAGVYGLQTVGVSLVMGFSF